MGLAYRAQFQSLRLEVAENRLLKRALALSCYMLSFVQRIDSRNRRIAGIGST
ncbi:hypothetical protein Poly59_20760 [Rubripirellula reticaptiva]|uniref:Uncharacterized protein n=1 Tax=Rubripirellula reticaptiva TaxID=2528013 RepID=A0A5C6F3Q4_9BACT|nr:hypothetical protein Poly59_20760 [Rubripirellula reticaptiva]